MTKLQTLELELRETQRLLVQARQDLQTLQSNEPAMRKLAYGRQARRAAFNYIVQPCDSAGSRAAIIGTTSFALDMSFVGSPRFPHVLVCCDCVIRPQLVIGSRHCVGHGAAGLLTGHDGLASLDPWLRQGTILLDNR